MKNENGFAQYAQGQDSSGDDGAPCSAKDKMKSGASDVGAPLALCERVELSMSSSPKV